MHQSDGDTVIIIDHNSNNDDKFVKDVDSYGLLIVNAGPIL